KDNKGARPPQNKDAPERRLRPRPGDEDVPLSVSISDIVKTNDAPEPWHGTYRFRFVMRFGEGERARAMRSLMELAGPSAVRDTLTNAIRWLDRVVVTPRPSDDPRELAYDVTCGTNVTSADDWPSEPVMFFGLVPVSFAHVPASRSVGFVFN